MRNIMWFGDVSNAQLGVYVTELPGIPVAAENGEWVQLRGVDGERFVSDGSLASVPIPVPLWVPPAADVNAVAAWLTGAGMLRFEGWPWFWNARVDTPPTLIPCVNNDGWTATVTFRAKPHRYVWPEAGPITLTGPGIVTNPATADALSRIEVIGSGDVTVMIGSYSVLIDGMSESITVDCESKVAYTGAFASASDQVSMADGLWPRLKPGENAVSWSGDVTGVVITPRWRWR